MEVATDQRIQAFALALNQGPIPNVLQSCPKCGGNILGVQTSLAKNGNMKHLGMRYQACWKRQDNSSTPCFFHWYDRETPEIIIPDDIRRAFEQRLLKASSNDTAKCPGRTANGLAISCNKRGRRDCSNGQRCPSCCASLGGCKGHKNRQHGSMSTISSSQDLGSSYSTSALAPPPLSHSISAPVSAAADSIPLQVQRQRLARPLSAAYGLHPRDHYAELKAAQARKASVQAQTKTNGRQKNQVQVVVFSTPYVRAISYQITTRVDGQIRVTDHSEVHAALGGTKMIGLFSVAPTHQVWVHQMADASIPFPRVSQDTPTPRMLLRSVALEDDQCYDLESEVAILRAIHPASIRWMPSLQSQPSASKLSSSSTPSTPQPFMAELTTPTSKTCGIFSMPLTSFLLEYNAHVMVSSLHLIVVTEIH
ncbi:hypothetical protein BKA70DRAFT_1563111 [Coprinopsis sp. MPI-PUGE-AT-0042]|nr:hypothetical protein BKA70DRAFT_1563111 [Coprinopsis sp. MPI-PUGE-AT-0042]